VTIADHIIKMLKDESGATAVEYALIAGAMGLCLLPALSSVKGGVDSLYSRIAAVLNDPLFGT
jgi:pilus assembly protein Flp/PilA